MKALSVKQPWASLIAEGIKSIEVRSWTTDHRGPLLICVSKNIETDLKKYYEDDKYSYALLDRVNSSGYGKALGKAICIVQLVNVVPLTDKCNKRACLQKKALDKLQPGKKQYAWILDNVQILTEPFDVKGQLGLFDVPM